MNYQMELLDNTLSLNLWSSGTIKTLVSYLAYFILFYYSASSMHHFRLIILFSLL